MNENHQNIFNYNNALAETETAICNQLFSIIDANLKKANCKIWHSIPVWFIDDNPIVGYNKQKNGICLLFWSGQSFDEPALKAQGKFKAAQIFFTDTNQILEKDIKRWLKKAATIQWDYKNIVKRKGVLLPLF
jgi:hypothetical protein